MHVHQYCRVPATWSLSADLDEVVIQIDAAGESHPEFDLEILEFSRRIDPSTRAEDSVSMLLSSAVV